MPHKPGPGAIFGIGTEDAAVKPNGRVTLLDRSNMTILARTVTDSFGGYVFAGLDPDTSDYMTLLVDDDGMTKKNAVVQDFIQPIPAHRGTSFPGNWFLAAMRLDPVGMFYPLQQNGYPVVLIPALNTPRLLSGNGVFNSETVTQGAPQIPTVNLTPGFALGTIRNNMAITGADRTANYPYLSSTLECVADTAVDFETTIGGGIFQYGPGLDSLQRIRWNSQTKTLSCQLNLSAGWPDVADNNGMTTYNIALPNLAAGIHHFVLSARWSIDASVYVDGTSVGEYDLRTSRTWPGNAPDINSNFSFGWGTIRVSGLNGTNYNGRRALAAAYPKRLLAADAQRLYNALIFGSSPGVTGYAREVVMDAPAMYVQCAAGAYGYENEFMTQRPLQHSGTCTPVSDGPVAGYGSLQFSVSQPGSPTGSLSANRIAGHMSPLAVTLEAWVKPHAAGSGVGSEQGIFLVSSFDGSFISQPGTSQTPAVARHYSLSLGADNQRVNFGGYSIPGVPNSSTFAYSPPTGVWTHIAVVMDKTISNPALFLYVNGLLQETRLIGGEAQFGNRATPDWEHGGRAPPIWEPGTAPARVSIGGGVGTFFGSIAHVAMYGTSLPASRVKAHYDYASVV